MAWSLPDTGEPENDIQSILFQEYLDALVAGINGVDCVLSGGAVTAQGSPNMTVAVAKAAILSNQVLLPVTAGNVTVTAADGTNPRLDLIVANSSGTKAIRTGTAAAAPKPPARSANDVVLAVVYVPANATTITTARIYDLRVVRTVGPITVYKTTTSVSFATTATIQTYLTLTIPNGLLLAGRFLRLRCGGSYLASSGACTYTLTVSAGGTLFADATIAATIDADPGAWYLDVNIGMVNSASAILTGLVSFQTPGAKVAPATGAAGDLGVATSVNAPINTTQSVSDFDTADRTLTVQWTMSVSNASNLVSLDTATVDLH